MKPLAHTHSYTGVFVKWNLTFIFLAADKQKASLPVWCCLLGGAVWTWPAGVAGDPLEERRKGEHSKIALNHMQAPRCPARANVPQETWHVTVSVATSTHPEMTKLQLLVSCSLLRVLTCSHFTMLPPAKSCYLLNRSKKKSFSTLCSFKRQSKPSRNRPYLMVQHLIYYMARIRSLLFLFHQLSTPSKTLT